MPRSINAGDTKKKKKKKMCFASFGRFISLLGLNSSLSSLTSEQACLCKREGGGDKLVSPGRPASDNRLRSRGSTSLSNYSAIVHWIGCINAIKLQI